MNISNTEIIILTLNYILSTIFVAVFIKFTSDNKKKKKNLYNKGVKINPVFCISIKMIKWGKRRENMQKIIGLTKNFEIVVAKIRYDKTGSNLKKDVGVSFDLSEIKSADATIRDANYMKDYYDCLPYQLVEKMVESIDGKFDEELMDLLDCSLYPEIINVDGEDYIFVASSCGQHDTREGDEMIEIVDQTLYDDIHDFWDNYHLQNIDDNIEAIELYESIVARMDKLDDEEIIARFVRKYKL